MKKKETKMEVKETEIQKNSLFEESWYLDAVAPDSWKEMIVDEKGKKARFVYMTGKQRGFKSIHMPPLTPMLGIEFPASSRKRNTDLSNEKKFINQIIDQLPSNANIDISLHYSNEYILPWIWRGFLATPRFSYRIENINNVEDAFSNFQDATRNKVHKATPIIKIRDDIGIDVLNKLNSDIFERQGRKNPLSAELVNRLDETLREHNACRFLCAEDKEGHIHGCLYFVFDNHTVFQLMGGGFQEYRQSGAVPLLVLEGIRFAYQCGLTYDFEGSMIEDIEQFNRNFGARPRVYYRVTRLNFPGSCMEMLKPSVKKLIGYR